ncbi:hypothetical protein QLG12_02815 [Pseudomonas sp. V88_4]|uniref:hypothetical protein n=1 Tax=Pseudomonas sp. V88_4 TaxID=3044229 RepID=UPI00249EFB5F|nr:hypothetical protein [Pseudomonas sp. V88_4]MDI3397136.1 hypothetical protein [Pseudomonas sp. V88_4]
MTTVTVSDLPEKITDAEVVKKLQETFGALSVDSFERSGDRTRARVVCVLPQPKQTQEKLVIGLYSAQNNVKWPEIAR